MVAFLGFLDCCAISKFSCANPIIIFDTKEINYIFDVYLNSAKL